MSSPQIAIDAATDACKIAFAEAAASQIFRKSLEHSITYNANLNGRDEATLRHLCSFPVVANRCATLTHDHPVMDAIRELIRNVYEQSVSGGVSHVTLSTLVVGASIREWNLYNSNKAIRFYFCDKDAKDVFRIMLPGIQAKCAKLTRQARRVKGSGAVKIERVASLRAMLQSIDDGRMPDTMCLNPIPSDVLLFEDTIYHYSEQSICTLFAETNATVGLGYCVLPHELVFPDYPPSDLYDYKVVDIGGVPYGVMTFPQGHSSGYAHPLTNWRLLTMSSLLWHYGNVWLTYEIIARIGPMVTFKIMRAKPNEILTRELSVPDDERWVKVLDVWASVDHASGELVYPLKYISVSESEMYSILNYLHSLDSKSLTVLNAVLMIRRRKGGASLLKAEHIAPWRLKTIHVYPVAFTAVLYVAQHQKDMELIKSKLDLVSGAAHLRRLFTSFVNVMSAPIKDFIDWLFHQRLQDKLILTPTHDCKRFDLAVVPDILPIHYHMTHITDADDGSGEPPMPDTPVTDVTSDHAPEKYMLDWRLPEPLSSPVIALPTTCDLCTTRKSHLDKYDELDRQTIVCASKVYKYTFSETRESLDKIVSEMHEPQLRETTALSELIRVYKAKVRKMQPFEHECEVHLIEGGPGTGKSHTIRQLHLAYAETGEKCMVAAPFSNLEADYVPKQIKEYVHSFNFKTNHKTLDLSGVTIIFIDEYTAFDFKFLSLMVGHYRPRKIFLVGDRKQTCILPEHGTFIGSKIPLNLCGLHQLTVNFRNPSNTVRMMNTLFGYKMVATRDFRKITIVDMAHRGAVQAVDAKPMYMTYRAIREYADLEEGENAEALKLTVKTNQGRTYGDTAVYITQYDTQLVLSSSLLIVALSRHKSNLTVVKVDSPAYVSFAEAVQLEAWNNSALDETYWREFVPAATVSSLCVHNVDAPFVKQLRVSVIPEEMELLPMSKWEIGDCYKMPDRGKHCGQRKLLLMELAFLHPRVNNGTHIVYIGAAPCDHFPFLHSSFKDKNVVWHMIDPNEFHPNVQRKNVYVYNQCADEQLITRIKTVASDILFISDIRSVMFKELKHDEPIIAQDMELQRNLAHILEARACMYKFRLPWNDESTIYDYGELWFQPWAPSWSTEMRLVTDDINKSHVYDHRTVEQICRYHNLHQRGHRVMTVAGPACFDCAQEINILRSCGFADNWPHAMQYIDELLARAHPDFRSSTVWYVPSEEPHQDDLIEDIHVLNPPLVLPNRLVERVPEIKTVEPIVISLDLNDVYTNLSLYDKCVDGINECINVVKPRVKQLYFPIVNFVKKYKVVALQAYGVYKLYQMGAFSFVKPLFKILWRMFVSYFFKSRGKIFSLNRVNTAATGPNSKHWWLKVGSILLASATLLDLCRLVLFLALLLGQTWVVRCFIMYVGVTMVYKMVKGCYSFMYNLIKRPNWQHGPEEFTQASIGSYLFFIVVVAVLNTFVSKWINVKRTTEPEEPAVDDHALFNDQITDYVRVPGNNDLQLMEATSPAYHDVVTSNGFENTLVYPIVPDFIEDKCLHRVNHGPYDAFRLTEFLEGVVNFDHSLLQTNPILNYYESQTTQFHGTHAVVDFEELQTPISVRCHPKDVSKPVGWKMSVGRGLYFHSENGPQMLKTVLDRYDKVRSKPKPCPELTVLTKAMCDNYRVRFKKPGFKPFYAILEDDSIMAMFAHKVVTDIRLRHYYEQFVGAQDKSFKEVRFNIKNIFKNVVIGKGFSLSKAGQGICTNSPVITSAFMFIYRMIIWYDSYTEKDDVNFGDVAMTDHTRTDYQYVTRFQIAASELFSGRTIQAVFIDGKEYDAQQGPATTYLTDYYNVQVLGVPEEIISKFRAFYYPDVKMVTNFMTTKTDSKVSGALDTLYTNGLPTKLVTAYVCEPKGQALLGYKGDDGILLAHALHVDDSKLNRVKKLLGLELYLEIRLDGNFCGYLFCPHGLFPDLIRRLNRLCGTCFRDYAHFCEYQISLRDYIQHIHIYGLHAVIQINANAHNISYDHAELYYYCLESWSHVGEREFRTCFHPCVVSELLTVTQRDGQVVLDEGNEKSVYNSRNSNDK